MKGVKYMVLVLYFLIFICTFIISFLLGGIIPGDYSYTCDNSILICLSLINASVLTCTYLILEKKGK